ncbi:hypothetical protein K1T71_011022 [Dendrolimus kikuchii]|uniref:Uncharacterized protein n=1 Tax=Dendrolimus kikuchii TaxID=765133 RepID=A0ACC1CQI9_9NEOP|nr:hypothetical protein K1T71_011022 [Dendrolimus kikuchii]
MKMVNKRYNLRPLPGGRRGTSGADAGCSSMRTIGDGGLSRRAPLNKYATSEISQQLEFDITSSVTTNSFHPIVSSCTTSTSPYTVSEDVAQETISVNFPVPTKDQTRTRKKWSNEMNDFILRTYLQLTFLETDLTSYLEPLHLKFLERFPHMEVSRQRVGDQRRAIVRRNLIASHNIEQIYEEVRSQLNNIGTPIQCTQSTTQVEHANTQNNFTQQPIHNNAKQRMRWTTAINEEIMRIYYEITNLETNFAAYRKQLHEKFIQKFPHLDHLTEQRISDQRRAIVNNKMIREDRLLQIKEEVETQILNINTCTVNDDVITQDIYTENTEFTSSFLSTPEFLPSAAGLTLTQIYNTSYQPNNNFNDINIERILLNKLDENIEKYSVIDPMKRPRLPKIRPSKKLIEIITVFNRSILPNKILSLDNITKTHTLIYCTAITILEYFKIKINTPNTPRTYNKPKWQERLQNQIENLRKDIGRLYQYKNGNRSRKLVNKVQKIIERTLCHNRHENINRTVDDFLDTIKQKLAVKTNRIQRYKKAETRSENNKLFSVNEKLFYRKLKVSNIVKNSPSENSLTEFWSNIWSQEIEHNYSAEWIQNEIERMKKVKEMDFDNIDIEELQTVINKTQNWKASGADGIHNYWFKKLVSLQEVLTKQISEIIKGTDTLPEFLTKGLTFMLPKINNSVDPSHFRAITCLPTLYKIITACIANKINCHIESNNILSEEQKGCRRFHMGCKEQLTIDSIALKYAQKNKQDLYISYIDYKKAFDSVPHSWLTQVLEIYKINPAIINFLKTIMNNWKTSLRLHTDSICITTREIAVKRGIFQGDSLSPLWFCLALNPLSQELNRSQLGFDIQLNRCNLSQITHLLYMDDLKLYSDSNRNITALLDITKTFSQDIRMDFGLDKCRRLNIRKGKNEDGNYIINETEEILAMKEQEVYKYLGYAQNRLIDHSKIKEQLRKEVINRIYKLSKSYLSSKNLFKAINTYAIPVLTYSFGIIKWSKTDLQKFEIKIRTLLTQFRFHHPKSSKERLTIKRKEGGRGLIDISFLHKKQVSKLKSFFMKKKMSSSLHAAICEVDKEYSPLNLSDNYVDAINTSDYNKEKYNTWKQKELHGRHLKDLDQQHIDKEASNKWLYSAGLFPETEGFISAIQDQIIATKNYRKFIIKDPSVSNDLCSKSLKHKLNKEPYTPYYKYKPPTVLENTTHKLYYDRTILTDHTVHNNRPDITLIDKENKHTYLIDIAIPNTHNIQSTITEKIRKYTELQEEVKRLWNMHKVTIVPIVVSTTGVIAKDLSLRLEILGLPKHIYISLQKAAILNTCRIVRKFLQLNEEEQYVTL